MYWYYFDREALRYPDPNTLIHIAELNTGKIWTGKFTKEQVNEILDSHPDYDYAWLHVYIPAMPKEYVINRLAFCAAGQYHCDFFDDGYCTGYDETQDCANRRFRKGILTNKYWEDKN